MAICWREEVDARFGKRGSNLFWTLRGVVSFGAYIIPFILGLIMTTDIYGLKKTENIAWPTFRNLCQHLIGGCKVCWEMRFQWLCVCLRLGAGPQVALKPWIKRWFTVASSFERQSGGRFKRPLPKWAKYESFVSSWKCYQCCWGGSGGRRGKTNSMQNKLLSVYIMCATYICFRFQNIYLKMYLCSLHCFCMSLRFEA